MTPRRRKQQPEAKVEPTPAVLIHDLATDHLQCRDFGHSWRPYTARWDSKQRAYETQLRCSRCRTVRLRWIGPRGEQLESRYDYADGYLIKGIGRLTGTDRDALRLESVHRVLPQDADEDEA